MGFLETCVSAWRRVLPLGSVLVVTVDGSAADAQRVYDGPFDKTKYGNVIRVGRPKFPGDMDANHRLGVAANKNTGIEYLMDAGMDHLFLCDDDTWPRSAEALIDHLHLGFPHSMVCWGKSRFPRIHAVRPRSYVEWAWPRGVLLYTHRLVIQTIGGMDERFGIGGHEHVEWSRRIHQAGFTPVPYISPASNAGFGRKGQVATGASVYWHAEDMPPRRSITSIQRSPGDWDNAERVMASRDGDTSYVPYQAAENDRASATLVRNNPSQGAEESK